MQQCLWGRNYPPPNPRTEELTTDAVVFSDSVGDLVGVDAELLADVPDVVDEADFRREEAVVRVLDHLGLAQPRLDDCRVAVGGVDERLVDVVEHVVGRLVGRAVDDLVRMQEVLDGSAHAEELGVHRERRAVEPAAFECGRDHVLGRPWDDRALHDDDVVVLARERFAERLGARLHNRGVDAAVRFRGRRQREERHVRLAHRVVVVRPAQPVARVLGDAFLESGFVNRRAAVVDGVDGVLVDIHVHDGMTEVRETRRDSRADVTAADDADVHVESTLPGLTRGPY